MAIAKWYYFIGFAATAVATWALRDYGSEWLADNLETFKYCHAQSFSPPPSSVPSPPSAPPPPEPGSGLWSASGSGRATCGGIEIALRVSFANFCFFALHFLMSLGMKSSASLRLEVAHAGLWLWRSLLWVSTLIGFFFVPASAVEGYGHFARVAAAIWLVLQMVLLVLLAYGINEWLLQRDNGWTRAALIILSSLAGALALALIAISYRWYAPRTSCGLNIFLITISLAAGLIMLALLAIPKRAPTSGLLTSTAVWLYCSYLLYSALSSEPAGTCRRGTQANPYWVQAVAFFLAIAALLYSTLSTGVGAGDDIFGPGHLTDNADATEEPLPYRADLFHFVFMLASAYAGMLFSSWRLSGGTKPLELDVGWASTWAKLGAKWFCEVLYMWTVVAPAIFRNRDFSGSVFGAV